MEPKPDKVRHCSGSSSLDEASCSSSTTGIKGASIDTCCYVHDSHCCSSPPWSKEASSAGGKKLWKRCSSKGETKINKTQGSTDAQLLEQRSTNSSEFDSPSLSGSLPSVADSHCSHFSSEISCSDPETSRQAHPNCSAPMDRQLSATAFSDVTVTPMPEVEQDHLEHCPSQSSHYGSLTSSPPPSPKEGSSGMFQYISEEGGGNLTESEPENVDKTHNTTNNTYADPEGSTVNHCIQIDI